jgi:hypothetical protein
VCNAYQDLSLLMVYTFYLYNCVFHNMGVSDVAMLSAYFKQKIDRHIRWPRDLIDSSKVTDEPSSGGRCWSR